METNEGEQSETAWRGVGGHQAMAMTKHGTGFSLGKTPRKAKKGLAERERGVDDLYCGATYGYGRT